MTPSWSLVAWTFLIGFCLGLYAALHMPQALSNLSALRHWALDRLHGVPACPSGYSCVRQ